MDRENLSKWYVSSFSVGDFIKESKKNHFSSKLCILF